MEFLYLKLNIISDIVMLKGDWFRLLAIISALIGVSTPFLWSHGSELRKKELEATKGELKPPDIDFSKPFELQFGGFHLITTMDELTEGVNLSKGFEIGFEYPFTIKFKNGKLLVSAEIKDENLETVAIIEDNEWTVNENDIIARDRNYNDYAFEVVDAHLRPRLQIVVKEQNKIYIGGYFHTEEGAILATPTTTYIRFPPEEIEEYIHKIFLYPSDEHLHQMVQSNN